METPLASELLHPFHTAWLQVYCDMKKLPLLPSVIAGLVS